MSIEATSAKLSHNKELNNLKICYKLRYGKSLLDVLLNSFKDSKSYSSLIKQILTNDNKIKRKEYHPQNVKDKKVIDDAKILYHLLENTKGMVY